MIALAALAVSALTASAAIYQSKVFSDQLSATVWPYLSFTNIVGDSAVQLSLENDGPGPALISGATLTVDGRPMTSLTSALKALNLKPVPRESLSLSSIAPGEVIRGGASATFVKISAAPGVGKLVSTAFPRVGMHVYYCSLLDRCWSVTLHSTGRPAEVRPDAIPSTGIQP